MILNRLSWCLACLYFVCSGIEVTYAHRYSLGQSVDAQKKHDEYFQSGQYFKEIEQQLEEGKEYLEKKLKRKKNHTFAIVMDIDETALSNFHHLQRFHFSTNAEALGAAHMMSNLPAIGPVQKFYQWARDHKVAIFFVSGRPNTMGMVNATVKNLRQAGYPQWTGLYLRPLDNDKRKVDTFKTHARRKIAQQGYEILVNIGDQKTDLQGGFAQTQIKLPNPFYLTPS